MTIPRAALLLLALPLGATLAGNARAETAVRWDGQFRTRYEFRDPRLYTAPGAGDVALMRARLGATALVRPDLRVYVQLQDSRAMGDEASTVSSLGNVDLHQAYADLDSLGDRVDLRVGRQELSYGDQRLIGPGDWTNVGRAFDGVRARIRAGAARVDAFAAVVREGTAAGNDRTFAGLWAALPGTGRLDLQLYHLWRDDSDSTFAPEIGTPGERHDRTAGVRVHAMRGRLDLRAEAAFQYGRLARDEVRARGATARLAVDAGTRAKLRLGAEYLYASGDDDPGDGKFGRFDPLFATGHLFLGAADLVGWSNVRSANVTLAAQAAPAWGCGLEVHRFELDSARDAWVLAGNTVARRVASGAAGRDLGVELDLAARWTPDAKLTVAGGVARFFAGDFVTRSGSPTRDTDWVWAQLIVNL